VSEPDGEKDDRPIAMLVLFLVFSALAFFVVRTHSLACERGAENACVLTTYHLLLPISERYFGIDEIEGVDHSCSERGGTTRVEVPAHSDRIETLFGLLEDDGVVIADTNDDGACDVEAEVRSFLADPEQERLDVSTSPDLLMAFMVVPMPIALFFLLRSLRRPRKQ